MPATQSAEPKLPVPSRRWGLRLLALLGSLLVLVWAAPMIVGWSPLVSWTCERAQNHINGTIHVGSASLGWFSPVVLYNVEVRDGKNRPIVQIQKIESDRSLLKLLLNRDDLGSFRIEKPLIEWTFHGNTSNLEGLLKKPALATVGPDTSAGQDKLPATLPHLYLDIVDGTVNITDDDMKLSWKAQSLTMSVLAFNDPDKTVHLNVQGALHDGIEAGIVKAEIHLQNILQANPQVTVKGRFSSFPLALANVLVRRWQPGTQLSGSLQGYCHLAASIKEGKPFVDLSGELTGNHVHVNSPLLAEQLHLERITAPCRLKLVNQWLTVEQAEMECDLGKASVQGSFDFSKEGLAIFDQPAFDLSVAVNLAILAERLPKTLHVHEGIRLSAGQLRIKCKSQASKNEGVVWQGSIHTTDVRGVKGDRVLAWSEPIQLDFQARNLSKGVPLIDELKCTSRFVKLEASTTPEIFTCTAQADLQQLVEPLGEFVDLANLKLGGQANAAVLIQRTPQDHFVLVGNAQVKKVNLSWFTTQPWQEEAITVKFNAQGATNQAGQTQVDSAHFEAELGSDLVDVQLLEVIPDLAAGPWGALSLRIEGDLTRWQKRLRGWTTQLDDWQLGGQSKIKLTARPVQQTVAFTGAELEATHFRCTVPNLWIDEPTLKLQTSGRWDIKTSRLELSLSKLTCPAVFVEAGKFSLHPATMTLHSSAQIVGDLARVRKWTQDPRTKPGDPLEGELSGRLDLESSEHGLTAEFDLTLKNVVFGTKANPSWREPIVECVGRGSYARASDTFQVEKLRVASIMLNANAVGNIAHVSSTRDIDLRGTLSYDLQKMEPQLRPLFGKDVKIAGKDTRAFQVSGPLYPRIKSNVVAVSLTAQALPEPQMHFTELRGEATLNWQALKALGCDVGPAEVKAVLQQGWFQLYPIETSLNGGRLRLQPNLRLEPAPLEMILLNGQVIDRAKITPEMCNGALGYALPLLAQVAQAEGLVSLKLEGGRISLAAPKTSEVKGTLVLHAAKLGANPIIRELSGLLKMPPPTSLVKECLVPFHMVAGKVYHRDLELAFPEFTVKSAGAVGLDGSLALVVEMPIPPQLAATVKLTPSQAKERIRIPIGGTIDQPRIDPRALESLTSTLGRSLLENQLNKILQPKQ